MPWRMCLQVVQLAPNTDGAMSDFRQSNKPHWWTEEAVATYLAEIHTSAGKLVKHMPQRGAGKRMQKFFMENQKMQGQGSEPLQQNMQKRFGDAYEDTFSIFADSWMHWLKESQASSTLEKLALLRISNNGWPTSSRMDTYLHK